jgi:hypothetical protein
VLTKLNTSRFAFVLVKVGAVPPAHLTLAGHVTVRAVPSAVNVRLNPMATPEVAGVFEMVRVVMFAFKLHVNKFPLSKLMVKVLVLMLILFTFSVYLAEISRLLVDSTPLVLTSLDP